MTVTGSADPAAAVELTVIVALILVLSPATVTPEKATPLGAVSLASWLNPVPVIVTAEVGGLRDGGTLADVSPTLLELMGQDQPDEMTGESLIEHSARI